MTPWRRSLGQYGWSWVLMEGNREGSRSRWRRRVLAFLVGWPRSSASLPRGQEGDRSGGAEGCSLHRSRLLLPIFLLLLSSADKAVNGIRKQRRTGVLARELTSLPTRLEIAASKTHYSWDFGGKIVIVAHWFLEEYLLSSVGEKMQSTAHSSGQTILIITSFVCVLLVQGKSLWLLNMLQCHRFVFE